jgi:Domain of unknown function (DUF4124)
MNIMNHTSMRSLGLLLMLTLCANTSIMAQLNKCKDDSGRIVYSDSPCRPPPPPKVIIAPTPAPTAKPQPPSVVVPKSAPSPAVNQASGGKLSEASVSALIRHAADLGMHSDHRAQCALAAPDIKFNITDQSTRPATVATGGRKELCDLQRDSALAIQAAQLQPVIDLSKQTINVKADGKQAIATYESTTTLSMQGQMVMRLRCARKETLSVYQDQILYSDVVAICKPQ